MVKNLLTLCVVSGVGSAVCGSQVKNNMKVVVQEATESHEIHEMPPTPSHKALLSHPKIFGFIWEKQKDEKESVKKNEEKQKAIKTTTLAAQAKS